MDAHTKASAVAMYLEGQSLREVAKAFEVATMTIQRWVKASGAPTRPRGRHHTQDNAPRDI